jgi:hypothetical protein
MSELHLERHHRDTNCQRKLLEILMDENVNVNVTLNPSKNYFNNNEFL